MEEGWKNRYADVLGAYADSIYALEGEFARQGEKRHLRIWGNHDDDWQRPAMVDKHLGGALKKRVRVHPAVILGDRILIAHGHQGDPNADYMARVSRLAVRYVWRHIQAIFNLERHVCGDPNVAWQRREHHLYEWAKARQMLLIAGHTHRPMFHHFSPTPYLHLLRDSLTQHLDAVWHDPLWRRLISAALACWDRLWERLEKEVALPLMPPAAPPLTPCYLNAGSCLSSGGITGIEIDRGEVRLIQWSGHGLAPQRNVYQQADLGAMLALI
jgi:predicted phosphodiesterase